MSEPFKLGELFCGCGGIGLGAMWAGCDIAWATDRDADACETYRRNLVPGRPQAVVCEDVRKLDFGQFAPVDLMAFGFPCNDFSVVNRWRRGLHGRHGALYTYCVEAVRRFRPVAFVAENVPGLLAANAGMALEVILQDFADVGYALTPHLYALEDYGVPQTRHRIVIVGIRRDVGRVFAVPSPAMCADRNNCARRAIENPPIPRNAPNNEFTKHSPRIVERLRYIAPGENATSKRIPPELRMTECGYTRLRYRRLPLEGPAPTVIAKPTTELCLYHWEEPRALTNREMARLQTFPDWFVFEGGVGPVRRQIGMAVPPKFAALIFSAVTKALAGEPYEAVTSNIRYGQRRLSLAMDFRLDAVIEKDEYMLPGRIDDGKEQC